MAHHTAKDRGGRVASVSQDSDDLDRFLGKLRGHWDTTGKAEPARRSKLQSKIVQAIEKLKKQVEDQLASQYSGGNAYPLFSGRTPDQMNGVHAPSPAPHAPRFPAEPVLRLYDKALVASPQASRFSEVDKQWEHLVRTLKSNAESTRRRAATYLIGGRYFPCGIIHRDLARFASAAEGQPWLGDVPF